MIWVILGALGGRLQGGHLLVGPEQEDAFALVGSCGLTDPRLGVCREKDLSVGLWPGPERSLSLPMPP